VTSRLSLSVSVVAVGACRPFRDRVTGDERLRLLIAAVHRRCPRRNFSVVYCCFAGLRADSFNTFSTSSGSVSRADHECSPARDVRRRHRRAHVR